MSQELSKALARHVNPLGHELILWAAAARALSRRARSPRFDRALAEFLSRWMPAAELDSVPAAFEVTVWWDEVSHRAALRSCGLGLAFADEPAWRALLHLPGLRRFWPAEMRASHYQHLCEVVPAAWVMENERLPPGAVIAGLELADWRELAELGDSGRSFVLVFPDGGRHHLSKESGHAGWVAAVDAALAVGGCFLCQLPEPLAEGGGGDLEIRARTLLPAGLGGVGLWGGADSADKSVHPPGQVWVAEYGTDDKGVHLRGARELAGNGV